MKYFAVLLPTIDTEKSAEFRAQHLDYLEKMRNDGHIFANGRFTDGSGGLVIYKAQHLEQAVRYVQDDPFVIHKARGYEIHEWDIVTNGVPPAR